MSPIKLSADHFIVEFDSVWQPQLASFLCRLTVIMLPPYDHIRFPLLVTSLLVTELQALKQHLEEFETFALVERDLEEPKFLPFDRDFELTLTDGSVWDCDEDNPQAICGEGVLELMVRLDTNENFSNTKVGVKGRIEIGELQKLRNYLNDILEVTEL